LARTAGVEVLAVQEAEMPCAPEGGYLQSAAFLNATKLR
jgi:hypothetical protein